jgi:hypothetical protein
MLELYRPELQARYTEVAESGEWILYRRIGTQP